eukprot:jgi/Tetstr1/453166/TSEL_040183.t1
MPPRPVPEDALVDDAPCGATAASIAELEKRLTAQAEALEKRLAEQFEAATAALLARLAPPVHSPPPKGTHPAIPAGALRPRVAPSQPFPRARLRPRVLSKERKSPFLLSWTHSTPSSSTSLDFAYFGQVPPSGLEPPPPRDGDEPRLWVLTDDTAARGLAEQRGLTAYDKYLYLRCNAKACGQSLAPTKFWSVSPLEPSAAWSFSATPTDWLRDACLAAGAQPPPSVTWASHRLRKGAASAASCYAAVLLLARPRPAATLRYLCKPLAFFSGKSCLLG